MKLDNFVISHGWAVFKSETWTWRAAVHANTITDFLLRFNIIYIIHKLTS